MLSNVAENRKIEKDRGARVTEVTIAGWWRKLRSFLQLPECDLGSQRNQIINESGSEAI